MLNIQNKIETFIYLNEDEKTTDQDFNQILRQYFKENRFKNFESSAHSPQPEFQRRLAQKSLEIFVK